MISEPPLFVVTGVVPVLVPTGVGVGAETGVPVVVPGLPVVVVPVSVVPGVVPLMGLVLLVEPSPRFAAGVAWEVPDPERVEPDGP